MAARIRRIASVRPTKIASPIEEMADVQLDDLRQRRDPAGGVVIEPVAGMEFEPEFRGAGGGDPDAAELAIRLLASSPCAMASHHAPVCNSTTGAPMDFEAFERIERRAR